MIKKITVSILWGFLITLVATIFFNILVCLFNLTTIIKNWELIGKLITDQFYWSLPSALGLGCLASLYNYFFFGSLFKLKNIWQNKAKSPFLVDQREKFYSMHQFKKIVSLNTNQSGVVLHWNRQGKKFNWYLTSNQHVRVIGSTGSYKTWFFIMANIYRNLKDPKLIQRPNMVIIDPKGEIYQNALKFNHKDQHYELLQIDFTNPKNSLSWNPLSQIWNLYHSGNVEQENLAINKIQDFFKSINVLDETNKDQPIWPIGARAYLTSILIFMLEYSKHDQQFTKDHFNLINLEKMAADLNKFKEILDLWDNQRDWNHNLIYPKMAEIRSNIAFVLDADDGPRTSHQATAAAAISQLVINKGLWQMLCENDFDFVNLFANEKQKPVAIFITYPDDLPAIHPLVSLVVSQAYQAAIEAARQNKRNGEAESLKRPLQFFIDEFGILPKLNQFENWINIARSRNIQIVIAYQSEEQLNLSYNKERQVIEDGFGAALLLSSSNPQTAERFSALVGMVEKTYESKSFSPTNKNQEISKNVSVHKERVLTPEEISQLAEDKYLLVLNNHKPAILTKKKVFQEMKSDLAIQVDFPKKTKIFDQARIVFDFSYETDEDDEDDQIEKKAWEKLLKKENEYY